MGWKTSHPHISNDARIGKHVDVEKFDDRGNKDKSEGKMKIDVGKPLVQDIKSNISEKVDLKK